jgi:hypothetical protein
MLAIMGRWFPFTARGLLFVLVALIVLRYLGLQEHDRLLLAAGVGSLYLAFLLALLILSVAVWLKFAAFPVTQQIDAMENVQQWTGLHVSHLPSLPCVVLRIRWLNFEGIDVQLVSDPSGFREAILSSQRQQRSEVCRAFEVSDVFGFCHVQICRVFPQAVRIEPLPAARCSVSQIRRDQQGEDLAHPHGKPYGDLIEMRYYRPGDPLKLVLWKHFARTRKLLVRQPENAIARMSQTVACFVAGPGDRATAGVARAMITELLQSGEQLLFQADGAGKATDDLAEVLDQIIHSFDARDQGGAILAEIGRTLQTNAIRHCIAFLPSEPGPWLDRVVHAQATTGLRIDALIGMDLPEAPEQPGWLPPWAFQPQALPNGSFAKLRSVVDRLSAAGISTKVIHRRSGMVQSDIALRGRLP